MTTKEASTTLNSSVNRMKRSCRLVKIDEITHASSREPPHVNILAIWVAISGSLIHPTPNCAMTEATEIPIQVKKKEDVSHALAD
jgi:hypothetical protein